VTDGADPELTIRALATGVGLGFFLATANLYMGLKTGWWDPGSITAAILAFALFRALRGLGGRPFSRLENNLSQATAACVGSIPSAAGMLGALPAITQLGQACPLWLIALWGIGLGVLGMLIALTLWRRLIQQERLPFPTGLATSEVIVSMYAAGGTAIARARALVGAAVASMIAVWFRDGRPALIPSWIALPGSIAGVPLRTLTAGISLSPMMFGFGLIIGPRMALSMLTGALIAWCGLAPRFDRLTQNVEGFGALQDLLAWPGAALMLSGALPAMLDLGRALIRGGRSRWAGIGSARVAALVGACAAFVIVLAWRLFDVSPWIGLVAITLALVLGSACARSAGETDVAPLGTMGNVTQLMLGSATRVHPVANAGAASIVAGSAALTVQTLETLKGGERLGSSPRRLMFAQFVGVVVGGVISAPIYQLFVRAYGLGTTALPAPSAKVWKSVAVLVSRGASLPHATKLVAAIALVVGLLLGILGRSRFSRFLPSAAAMGAGFIMPASYVITIAIGALVFALFRWRNPDATDTYSLAIGSGAAAGEAVMGLVVAILVACGILQSPL
jgi:uncharacterized oligopeptide transporter (OPT) family protein